MTKAQWLHATAYIQAQIDSMKQQVQAMKGIGVDPAIAASFGPSKDAEDVAALMPLMLEKMEEWGHNSTKDTYLLFIEKMTRDASISGEKPSYFYIIPQLTRAMGVSEGEHYEAVAKGHEAAKLMASIR